ncbi:protrudin-like [Apostichopus japonicus]|uniref:protrudin-like n=1 Tax=Stichopus japonicus TaxID=307972 RepID=UPI003AB6961B
MAEDGDRVLEGSQDIETNGKSLNINTLVERYRHFQSLVWPLVAAVQSIVNIVRWQSPRKTIQAWVISLLLCLSAEKYYLLLLSLTLLAIVAIIGWLCRLNFTLVQEHHSQWSSHTHPSKVIPDAILDDSTKHNMRNDRKKQMVADCRSMIQDLLQVLNQFCELLENVYSLLSWSSVQKSIVFYTSAAVALLSSFLLPLCFSLSIQVCLIFGANPGFFRYLHNTDAVTDSLSTDDRDDAKTTPVPKPQITIETDTDVMYPLDNTQVEPEPLGAESERECKDEDSSSLGSGERSYQDKEEGNQKFSEKGECFSCMAAFNNFTKRRRYCRHCGNHFCPKCCNKKLPRSALGATSPAAKVEKELVCNQCWMELTN